MSYSILRTCVFSYYLFYVFFIHFFSLSRTCQEPCILAHARNEVDSRCHIWKQRQRSDGQWELWVEWQGCWVLNKFYTPVDEFVLTVEYRISRNEEQLMEITNRNVVRNAELFRVVPWWQCPYCEYCFPRKDACRRHLEGSLATRTNRASETPCQTDG